MTRKERIEEILANDENYIDGKLVAGRTFPEAIDQLISDEVVAALSKIQATSQEYYDVDTPGKVRDAVATRNIDIAIAAEKSRV